jgi:hypothetical protein
MVGAAVLAPGFPPPLIIVLSLFEGFVFTVGSGTVCVLQNGQAVKVDE